MKELRKRRGSSGDIIRNSDNNIIFLSHPDLKLLIEVVKEVKKEVKDVPEESDWGWFVEVN